MAWKIAIAFLSVVLVMALGISLLVERACDPCGNEELKTILSPDAKLKAVIFQRDCGATTGFSTHVSLLSSSKKPPREPGNTFILDTDHGRAPTEPGGGPEVILRWVDERVLFVKYDKRARIFRSERSVDGVTIRYNPQ